MEDGCVIGDVTLKELYPGDLDHLLLAEVLVQCANASPLPPRPRLLCPLTVSLNCVHTIVISGPESWNQGRTVMYCIALVLVPT